MIPIVKNIPAIKIKKFLIAPAMFIKLFSIVSLPISGVKKNSEIQLCPPNVARSPLIFGSTVTVVVSRKFGSAGAAAKEKCGKRMSPSKRRMRIIVD